MNPEDTDPNDFDCDCSVCEAGLTPSLNEQEAEAVHRALLLASYLTAGPQITADPDFPMMVARARLSFRDAAAALGGTWTLARAVAL